jgi:hypothetical protein
LERNVKHFSRFLAHFSCHFSIGAGWINIRAILFENYFARQQKNFCFAAENGFFGQRHGMDQAAEFDSIINRGDRASLLLKTVMTRVDRLKAEDC